MLLAESTGFSQLKGYHDLLFHVQLLPGLETFIIFVQVLQTVNSPSISQLTSLGLDCSVTKSNYTRIASSSSMLQQVSLPLYSLPWQHWNGNWSCLQYLWIPNMYIIQQWKSHCIQPHGKKSHSTRLWCDKWVKLFKILWLTLTSICVHQTAVYVVWSLL